VKDAIINFTYPILFFTLFLSSQSSNAFPIERYGLKVGTSIANQNWNYYNQLLYIGGMDENSKNRIGLDAAIWIQLLEVKYISIISEFHYIQKGMRITVYGTRIADNPDGYEDLGPEEYTRSVNYLCLPILLKANILQSSFSPYIILGPRVDFLIYNDESVVYDNFNKFDYGISVGFGFEKNFGAITFLMELRYSPTLNYSYQNQYLKVIY